MLQMQIKRATGEDIDLKSFKTPDFESQSENVKSMAMGLKFANALDDLMKNISGPSNLKMNALVKGQAHVEFELTSDDWTQLARIFFNSASSVPRLNAVKMCQKTQD